jgi:flagellum-specific peptidoglycan hydrolase FlgJ
VAPPASKPTQARRHAGGHIIAAGDAGQSAQVVQGRKSGKAEIPGTDLRPAPAAPQAKPGQAEIPGLLKRAPRPAASPRPASPRRELAPYRRHQLAPAAQQTAPGSAFQRAFIEQVAPGAIATQHKYGVPASVTIAQAIDESAWGQSILATHDHNLFGIKGTGPAGSDVLPTQEFTGGQLVDTTAPFRVYNDIGQSIEAHGKLLARSDYFTHAMANRHQPNAFAAALTGVYATDPSYGAKLIELMQHYNLYRFDVAAAARSTSSGAAGGSAIPGINGHGSAAHPASGSSAAAEAKRTPGRAPKPAPTPQPGKDRAPGRAGRPAWNQGADSHGAAARRAQHAGSSDAGWASDGGIPGTGYPIPAARRAPGAADQAARPGQADIPGLPGAAEAPKPHRRRNAPRLGPPHPPASGHRAAPAQPAGGAPGRRGHQGSSPAAAAPGSARPEPTMPEPAVPAPAMPGTATWNDRPRRDPVNPVAAPGDWSPPIPAGFGPGRSAAGPAARMTAGIGDSLIPGVPPAPTGPADAAYGSGAMPQDGAVPRQGAAPQDGAWIPGLPGDGSESARHVPHRNAAARHGPAALRAAHGTNLAPTRARRFASAGQPSAQPGRRAASASQAPAPVAPPTLAPVSAQRAGAPAAPATAPGAAPPRDSLIPGLSDGVPPSSRRTGPAPVAPSSAPGPAPTSGGEIPRVAPAAPASPPTPAPARGAGATYGAGEAAQATTTAVTAVRYSHHLPPAVGKAYLCSAKVPLVRGEPLYVDVAAQSGLSWEILAACDWMQCKARPGLSPVYGEKLGMVNPDGTSYRTRSAALERCAYDLVELARSVYHIDLTRSGPLSVRELANAFAAFRWGGLLKEHHTSAMEFPYSVAGLTTQHMHMRWPNIDDPQAPDRPGARFHQPFGAVPLVLSLNYPAIA